MAKGQPFNVRLQEETERLVEAEARRTRRTKSAIVEAFTEETARTRRFPGIGLPRRRRPPPPLHHRLGARHVGDRPHAGGFRFAGGPRGGHPGLVFPGASGYGLPRQLSPTRLPKRSSRTSVRSPTWPCRFPSLRLRITERASDPRREPLPRTDRIRPGTSGATMC